MCEHGHLKTTPRLAYLEPEISASMESSMRASSGIGGIRLRVLNGDGLRNGDGPLRKGDGPARSFSGVFSRPKSSMLLLRLSPGS